MIDPRVRLLLVFVLAVLAVTVRGTVPLSAVFALSLILALSFRVGPRSLVRPWMSFASLFLFVSVIQSLFGSGEDVILGLGNVAILTFLGLRSGLLGLLRLLTVLQGGLVLARVRTRDMTRAFQRIGLPGELALASALGAGFVPLLGREFRDALDNLRTRGVPLEGMSRVRRARLYLRLFAPVLGLTIRKAKELSEILELRGFRSRGRRTDLKELRFRSLDWALMGFAVLLLVLGLVFFSI